METRPTDRRRNRSVSPAERGGHRCSGSWSTTKAPTEAPCRPGRGPARKEEQRIAIAARRGLRGYSEIVQEAIDAYLADAEGDELDALLSLRGSLTDEEADALECRIAEAWSTWPSGS